MMERISVDECLNHIDEYVNNTNAFYPLFVSVDGADEYKKIKSHMASYESIRLSAFCKLPDAKPDFDQFYEQIENMEPKKAYCLFGLGDYVALTDDSTHFKRLAQKEIPKDKKLIVLCRGIAQLFEETYRIFPKFSERRCFVESKYQRDYSVNNYSSYLTLKETPIGFKKLLEKLEDGFKGTLRVSVPWPFNFDKNYDSYYAVVCDKRPEIKASKQLLDDEQWKEFYNDSDLSTSDVWSWRYFLKLKITHEDIDNPYLKLVCDCSDSFDVYQKNLFFELLNHDVKERDFDRLYDARKDIMSKGGDSRYLGSYIAQANSKAASVRCRYLTDQTDAERSAIVKTICDLGRVPDGVEKTAPLLAAYMADYDFPNAQGKSEIFASYFSEYKRLKLTNCSPSGSSFFDKVESYAVDRQYLGLSTRGDLVDQMRADDVVLYWLDALGVEYLGFIKRRAQEKGMALEIKIGRASIPTITSMNCDFYNSWEMGKKQKDSALDDLLHKNDKDVKASPEYLFLALEIIDAALQKIQKMLAKGECSAVLLASDHGSSRLAALYDAKNFISQLESGGTIDDGEHCGRCCPAKTGDNVPSYAVAEGEYWAIANYECFKGSSRRGYEYHGGATLEEILVPVVRFTLANEEEKPDINPIATKICVNRREAPRVAFTSSRASNSYRVCLLEKFYSVNPLEERSYEAVLEDFFERKLKLQEYDVDIYDGENKLATLRYSFEGETMNVNKKQSEFFD